VGVSVITKCQHKTAQVERLKLKYDKPLSNFAFNFNLRHYTAALGGLTSLTRLFLEQNQLTSVPAALGALTALKELDLDMNQLTSVPAAWEEGGVLEKSGCSILRQQRKI